MLIDTDLRWGRQQIGSAPPEISSGLQGIIDAWPSLPEAIKAGILALVRAAEPRKSC